jgi:SAM-dependent methyltransferase
LTLDKKIKISLDVSQCPFCKDVKPGSDKPASARKIVHRLKYSDVLLGYPGIEDFEGWVEQCDDCGIYFVNPRYDEKEFSLLYKNLSKKGSSSNLVKNIASWPTRFAMGKRHVSNPVIRFFAVLAGKILDPVLQMPIPAAPVPNSGRILDVGCGDGFHLRCLYKDGVELYATELHRGYEETLAAVPEILRFWIDEFTSINWEKETGCNFFDLIIFQSVFYRLNNPKISLDLAWKLLKPGGTILRIEPFCPDPEAVKLMTTFNFPQGFTYVRDIDTYVKRLKQLYPGAGFKWKIYYGRSAKTKTGKDFTPFTAFVDLISRIAKTILKKEPYFLRLDMKKEEGK